MTIRLTSPESFDKVLEKLKKDPMYSEERNSQFMKYCFSYIREEIAKGNDEYYLDVGWVRDPGSYEMVMTLRYLRRSDALTDVEFLTDKNENK